MIRPDHFSLFIVDILLEPFTVMSTMLIGFYIALRFLGAIGTKSESKGGD